MFPETAPIRILLLGAPKSRILIGAVSRNGSNKRLQNCSPLKFIQGNELIHCLPIKGLQICSLLLELFLETAAIRKHGELLLLFSFSKLVIKNLDMRARARARIFCVLFIARARARANKTKG